MKMNNLKVFNNEEFGRIRTITKDGEPWFVGKDITKSLGYQNGSRDIARHVDEDDQMVIPVPRDTQNRNMLVINESGLYSLVISSKLPNAKKFKRWVTSEVLPSIRRTGSYSVPMSTGEQIQLLAKGNVELGQRVDKVEDKVRSLEDDMPLYGCEIDEVQKHVRRKGVDVLGGKNSEAYHDGSIRSKVYSDIYSQLKREYGCVSSYKSIKRKYISGVHDFIDGYEPPTILCELIADSNAQRRIQ